MDAKLNTYGCTTLIRIMFENLTNQDNFKAYNTSP